LIVLLLLLQADLSAVSAQARSALEARNYPEAIRLYTQLTKALPDNAGLRFNLGLALHSAGRHREAIPHLSAAATLTPAKLVLALCYLKLNEASKALPLLEQVVQAEPANAIARLELADACLQLARFDDAAIHFDRLSQLDPKHPKAWQGLGLAHLGASRRAFEALEKDPAAEPWVLALRARSLLDRRQYQTAFHLYKQAQAAMPALPGVGEDIAEIYRQTGHPDWAAIEEERGRRLAASPAHPLYAAARRHQEKALAAFARLAELPPSAEIHELTSAAYRIQGRHQEAAAALREALRLDPANPRLEASLASNLRLHREFGAALPILERLVLRDPQNAQLAYELGDCLLELHQPEKALRHLQRATRLLPARAALGRALLLLDRPAEAVAHLQAALGLDEDGSLHFQLLRAARLTGRPELIPAAQAGYDRLSRRPVAGADRPITGP